MPWRLLVVDGADAKRFFPLPDAGTLVLGNSHKYADICLHDLVMARVHCQLEVEDDTVTVTALDDDKETRIDGQRITAQILSPGAVLRVGNTQLCLEAYQDEDDVVDDVEVDEVVDDVEVEEPASVSESVPKALPQVGWKEMEKLAGHTLGHFELLKVLGRGHTAVTFLAHDSENRRDVALKIIGPAFPADPDELQRFARVVRKVAAIEEEHLIRWYAAGRTNKLVWISQEHVEGESLANILQRGQSASMMLKWRNALKLAIDLGKALACLHRRHIFHGNLTPANVIVGIDRMAKLNDLMYGDSLIGSDWHTERLEAKLLAELPYLAPERMEEGAYWDGSADIYSLGALTYARLTGRPPFEGRTPGAMIDAIREGKLVKPRDIVRGCPEIFQAAVLKMLAHNPEDRFQSPDQLVLELEGMHAMA